MECLSRLLCGKFAHTRFEPSGWTGNAELGYAKSVMDYIFRWMELRFLSGKQQLSLFYVANDGKEIARRPDSADGSSLLQSDRENRSPGETREPPLESKNCCGDHDRT